MYFNDGAHVREVFFVVKVRGSIITNDTIKFFVRSIDCRRIGKQADESIIQHC